MLTLRFGFPLVVLHICNIWILTECVCVWPHLDAVVVAHGHPHGHGDGTDAAEHVQQGETETLTKVTGGFTGEAGTAPEGKAAFSRIIRMWRLEKRDVVVKTCMTSLNVHMITLRREMTLRDYDCKGFELLCDNIIIPEISDLGCHCHGWVSFSV